MPTTKEGEKISWKEFMKRWKSGINGITPQQRLKNELISTGISEVGYIVGLIALIIFRDKLLVSWFAYGLILIFVGSVWATGLKFLITKQQLNSFKNTDNKAINIDALFDALEKEEIKEEKITEQDVALRVGIETVKEESK
jgi:hypothetical protein